MFQNEMKYFPAVPLAPRWLIFLAKVFGVKREAQDGTCKVTMHYFMGKYYVTKILD